MANVHFVPGIVIETVIAQETLYAFSEVGARMYQVVSGDQIVPVSKLKTTTSVSSNQ